MSDTATDAPVEEEVEAEPVGPDQPSSSEELAVYQEANEELTVDTFDGVTDSVPGAVTDLTPELSKKAAKAEGPSPLAAGGQWLQLAATDNVEELGLTPGTRVRVVSMGPVELADEQMDPYHPVYEYPEDNEILVQTRDAKSQTVTVTRDDLEPVPDGSNKG